MTIEVAKRMCGQLESFTLLTSDKMTSYGGGGNTSYGIPVDTVIAPIVASCQRLKYLAAFPTNATRARVIAMPIRLRGGRFDFTDTGPSLFD
jgi:hypothetical protein